MLIKLYAKLHRKNRDKEYVQGWYCWPKRSRWPRLRKVIEFLCGLTGHEISKTEWGWGGGEFVDGNCRWCDKHMTISQEEARFRFPTFNFWGRFTEFNRKSGGY